MSAETLKCLRCEGQMNQGFIIDKTDSSLPETQKWVEGIPERSFFTGLKLKNRKVLVVVTHRCEKCGYLESYAKDAV